VQQWVADYLKQSVWQRAVSQYIGILAGKAEIKGFKLKAAETPLVQ
jgi:peptidyl-prolyl cis-trans isomerase C